MEHAAADGTARVAHLLMLPADVHLPWVAPQSVSVGGPPPTDSGDFLPSSLALLEVRIASASPGHFVFSLRWHAKRCSGFTMSYN